MRYFFAQGGKKAINLPQGDASGNVVKLKNRRYDSDVEGAIAFLALRERCRRQRG